MSDDLVKRARGWNFCWPSHDVEMLVPAMADRIEELETQLSEARQVGKEWFEEQKKARKDANAAEAKLAKAVLSVKRLSTSECFGSSEVWGLSLSDSPLGREILARMDYANTTLAELKGETE